MPIIRILLLLAWLSVVAVTVVAVRSQGMDASMQVFMQDLAALDWRAQYDADLMVHIVLIGLWAAWRQKFSLQGIVTGLLCGFGSLFSAIYVLGLTLYHKGDMTAVLLGRQRPAQA